MSSLRRILRKEPTNALAHYYLGIMKAQEGPLTQAEKHLRAALQAWPDSADILFRLGEVLHDRRRRDEALVFFDKARQADPQHAGALGRLGLHTFREKRLDEAIDLLTRARAGAPEDREILETLGATLSARNLHAQAIEVLQAALRLDESSAEAHWLLGQAYEALNRTAEAAAAFGEARRLGRRDRELRNLIGYDLARALNDTGKVEEAIAEYRRAIRSSPEPAVGWFELAQIYADQGEERKAINAYERAFSLDSDMGEALLRIGKIHRDAGELEKALAVFERIDRRRDVGEQARIEIKEIRSTMTVARRDELAEIAASGSEEQRERAYREMLEIDKTDREAYEGLIALARERGDFGQAKTYLRKMKRAGLLIRHEGDVRLSEMRRREEAGEHLNIWKNRLEEFRRREEWDKAIAENAKLRAHARERLDHWRKYSGDEDRKAEMIRATRARLQAIAQTDRDLRAAKNRFR